LGGGPWVEGPPSAAELPCFVFELNSLSPPSKKTPPRIYSLQTRYNTAAAPTNFPSSAAPPTPPLLRRPMHGAPAAPQPGRRGRGAPSNHIWHWSCSTCRPGCTRTPRTRFAAGLRPAATVDVLAQAVGAGGAVPPAFHNDNLQEQQHPAAPAIGRTSLAWGPGPAGGGVFGGAGGEGDGGRRAAARRRAPPPARSPLVAVAHPPALQLPGQEGRHQVHRSVHCVRPAAAPRRSPAERRGAGRLLLRGRHLEARCAGRAGRRLAWRWCRRAPRAARRCTSPPRAGAARQGGAASVGAESLSSARRMKRSFSSCSNSLIYVRGAREQQRLEQQQTRFGMYDHHVRDIARYCEGRRPRQKNAPRRYSRPWFALYVQSRITIRRRRRRPLASRPLV
jgi:hypothetical protein